MFTIRGRIVAFERKASLCQTAVSENVLAMFPNLSDFISEHDMDSKVLQIVLEHLVSLEEYFNLFFWTILWILLDFHKTGNLWIADPFSVNSRGTSLHLSEKSCLAELASDDALKLKLRSSSSRFEFWAGLEDEFPLLHKKAVKVLLQFLTTYLCEKTFSAVTAIKTRYRSA